MQRRLSIASVERLVRYYRCVDDLKSQGEDYVSSRDLAVLTGYTAAQVRKDLTWHGALGVPGRGYEVDMIHGELGKLLDKEHPKLMALVGVGHLGLALLRHPDFQRHGFHIVAGFETDLQKVGHSIDGVYIYNVSQIERICPLLKIGMGLIAVPSPDAQKVADSLVRAQVVGILNFAAVRLIVPSHIQLQNVDLSVELEKLHCRVAGWI